MKNLQYKNILSYIFLSIYFATSKTPVGVTNVCVVISSYLETELQGADKKNTCNTYGNTKMV